MFLIRVRVIKDNVLSQVYVAINVSDMNVFPSEISAALKKLKNGKAAGQDELHANTCEYMTFWAVIIIIYNITFCRSSPMLEALQINKISTLIDVSRLDLLRSHLNGISKGKLVYTYMLKLHLCGISNRHLFSRVQLICDNHNVFLLKYVFDNTYATHCKSKIKAFKTWYNGLCCSPLDWL